MDSERAAFQERFEQMGDDELLRRFRSGEMTSMAREVAAEALRERGISPELEPAPADSDAEIDPDPAPDMPLGDIVCLTRFSSPVDAALLCGLLNAEGIPAVEADANLVRVNSMLTQALGGIRVMVGERDLPRAREIVQALHRGEFALSEDDEG